MNWWWKRKPKPEVKATPIPENRKDVVYTDDPTPKGFIRVNELTQKVFDDNIKMYIVGKGKDGKWSYYAQELKKDDLKWH